MKTFFTLLAISALLLLSFTTKAQFTQNFEGTEANLTGNCWILSEVYKATDNKDFISGTGSLYTNPPTSGTGTRNIFTPVLDINSTTLTVSFKYKVSSKIGGNATRTIEVGLLDGSGTFTSLDIISMDNKSATTVYNYNKTFTLATLGQRRLVLKLGGTTGDGNSRLIFDDLYVSANPHYGPVNNCNNAPIAADDNYQGPQGTVIAGNVLNNDNEPDGEGMTPAIVTAPVNGVVVLNADGSFIFTPNAGFTGNSFTFTYQLTDNSPFAVTSNIATVTIVYTSGIILPVALLNFDANYKQPDVLLNWSTSQEKDFSHFVIEKSTDGIVFSQVGIEFGTGESDSRKNYFFADKKIQASGGLIYYRLKSVDKHGSITYSPNRIISLHAAAAGISITTYPNPVRNVLSVIIPADWQGKTIKIEMYNTNGQKVKDVVSTSASQTMALPVNEMNRGMYIIKAICGSEMAIRKVIKN
jgi:hypothetical protein